MAKLLGTAITGEAGQYYPGGVVISSPPLSKGQIWGLGCPSLPNLRRTPLGTLVDRTWRGREGVSYGCVTLYGCSPRGVDGGVYCAPFASIRCRPRR